MKRLILAAVVVATSAEADPRAVRANCTTFLDLARGEYTLSQEFAGYIAGFFDGVEAATSEVSEEEAMDAIRKVCAENPTFPMRRAVQDAAKVWSE